VSSPSLLPPWLVSSHEEDGEEEEEEEEESGDGGVLTKSSSSNNTEYLDKAAGELWQISTSFNANGIVFHVLPFTLTRMRFARIGLRFKLPPSLSRVSLKFSFLGDVASDDANKISLKTSSMSFASAAHNHPVDRRSSSAFFVNVKHGAKTAGSVFIPINFGAMLLLLFVFLLSLL
tara:strand:+ start:103 stop:630 length:528 start_codon:yes stop_codon:yes gene_type:complete